MVELLNIDCLEYMAGLPDKAFDLAIVDPPYMTDVANFGFWGKGSSSIGVERGRFNIPEWDGQIPGQPYLDELLRVSRNQIIWGINYFKFYHCAGRIVWDKVNGDSCLSDAEIASCSFHDSTRLFVYMWNGMNQAESLKNPRKQQGNKKLNEKRIHATQKPVNLYMWLLNKYAKPGYRILDTHLGSGSHAIACEKMGFDLVATEINTDCYNAAVKRFKNFKMQQTIKF